MQTPAVGMSPELKATPELEEPTFAEDGLIEALAAALMEAKTVMLAANHNGCTIVQPAFVQVNSALDHYRLWKLTA
jgi:hypothetical protein